MQVNLNCNTPKPQFGMAVHSNPNVNNVIKHRVKDLAQLKRIENIFKAAEKNGKVDVNLMVQPDGKTICANIYATNPKVHMFKSRSENFFTKIFGGGIEGFIESCVKTADKMESKAIKAEEIINNKTF